MIEIDLGSDCDHDMEIKRLRDENRKLRVVLSDYMPLSKIDKALALAGFDRSMYE